MKINAIEGRGSRKDFVDIYFLLQHYTLQQVLDFYRQKYPEYSHLRALMSLAYFQDAEQQPMPYMIAPVTWGEIKDCILRHISNYNRQQTV